MELQLPFNERLHTDVTMALLQFLIKRQRKVEISTSYIRQTENISKSEDEMTNIGEYNFAQNVSLNMYQLNAKKMNVHIPFFHFQ